MPTQNSSIQLIQAELLKRFRQLQQKLDDTTDLGEAQAILREMQEVNHRVTIAGSLLFAKQSATLSAEADAVRKASKEAAAAIRDFQAIKDIMDAITGFLQIVDAAIDLAKSL